MVIPPKTMPDENVIEIDVINAFYQKKIVLTESYGT